VAQANCGNIAAKNKKLPSGRKTPAAAAFAPFRPAYDGNTGIGNNTSGFRGK